MSAPPISVVIPAYRAGAVLPACLASLARQTDAPSFEVIVAISGPDDGAADWVRRHAPWVRLIVSPERRYCGGARNLGAMTARGAILVFLDADCTVEPGWVAAISEAHRRELSGLIGGVIENDPSGGLVGWGYYFACFGNWLPRRSRTPVQVGDLAGPCLSLRRALFDAHGGFAEGRLGEDTDLCWRLAAQGHPPVLDPTIVVRHTCELGLIEAIRRRFDYGAVFARLRAEAAGWGRGRQRLQAIAAPLVPALLLARIVRRVWQAGSLRGPFLRALPVTTLACIAWAAGEAWGYLFAADWRA